MSITEDTGQTTLPATRGWTADASTFGARLALIRQHMGWGNIAKAAKECGVPTDSWRNWEVDGREPHRLVTIALTIATRTGCDLDWLVYGPNRGRTGGTQLYVAARPRVIKTVGTDDDRSYVHSGRLTRPVRQTRPAVRRRRPIGGGSIRPDTPVAV